MAPWCHCVVFLLLPTILLARTVLNSGNPDAKRLYDDLLSNYNKLVRPVVNTTDPLTVRIKLKLSQLIDVVSSISFEIGLPISCRSKTRLGLHESVMGLSYLVYYLLPPSENMPTERERKHSETTQQCYT